MSEKEIIIQKCKEMGIKFSSKARIQNLKKKLADLGVDVESITYLRVDVSQQVCQNFT